MTSSFRSLIVIFCFICLIYCSYAQDSNSTTLICTRDGKDIICEGETFEPLTQDHIPPSSYQFYIYLVIAVILVLFAGLCSGLTIGLMSLDPMTLEIIKKGGDEKERRYAEKIIPVIERHHLLLVTLLLSNAAAMEALPIFLDRISSPIIAILVSVTMVLFFGEIIPQALCHRFGLAIGATLAPVVKFMMIVLFVIAWPISKLLDYLLGHGGDKLFKRTELKELVALHGQEHAGPLTVDEMTIIKGALDLKHKSVQQFMTPLEKVFMLDMNSTLDKKTMELIKEAGHSRIPVYSETKANIKGLLLVKSLLFLNLDNSPKISDLELREIPTINGEVEAYEILNMFQTGRSHIAAVSKFGGKDIIGVVTLEDIIEELIQEEIYDEEDLAEQYAENAKKALEQYKMYRRGLSLKPTKDKKGMSKLKSTISEDIAHLVSEDSPHIV